MNLSEYVIMFVLVAIMGAGLPGPGDASLIAAGTLPTLLGFAGWILLAVALALGAMMLTFGLRLARDPNAAAAARSVMFASLLYLPIVFLVIVLDRV